MTNYWDYRNQVISKNLGAHAHEIHSSLGIILNTISFTGYVKYRDIFTPKEQKQHIYNVGKAIRFIYKVTGIEPDGDLYLPKEKKCIT